MSQQIHGNFINVIDHTNKDAQNIMVLQVS